MNDALLLQILDRIATALEVNATFFTEMSTAHAHSTPEEEAEDKAFRERDLKAREESNEKWREHNRLHATNTPHGESWPH